MSTTIPTRRVAAAVILGAAVATWGMTAAAQEDGAIKYRQSIMRAVGGHFGAMVGVMKQQGGQPADLAMHAQAVANLAKVAGGAFPEGSDFGETAALPVIWEKPDDFAKALKALQDSSAELATVAQGGDMAAFGVSFGKVGEACKNCHENFREKKQK